MAESIVKSALIKLNDDVLKEVLLKHGIGEQVETVRRELSRIQAFLMDVDEKQITDERQKHWVKEVKGIAHSIEHIIDTFLLKVRENPQELASMTMPTVRKKLIFKRRQFAVHKLVNKITQIQERMIEINASRKRFGINTLGEDSGEIKLPIGPPVLPGINPNVVGFKESQDDETKGRQSQMDVPDPEKCQEDETMSPSTLASLTTTPEGNKDEKLLYILLGLITLLATAAGIAAILVPENSRKKTLGKICSGLFDILVLIFLGGMIILGIYVQISKVTRTKHISNSYVVFFFILVVCSILKMLMVAVRDL